MQRVIGRYEYEKQAEELRIPFDQMYTRENSQKIAIRNYTKRRHREMNVEIREECSHPKHLLAVSLLMEALEELPKCDQEYVVRWSDLSPELIEMVKEEGTIIQEKGFTSTSTDKNFELDKAYKLVIKHYNGKYIEHLTACVGENEVLIPADSYFEVIDFDEDTSTVYLNQLTPEEVQAKLATNGGDE